MKIFKGLFNLDTPLVIIGFFSLLIGSASVVTALYGSPQAWDLWVKHAIGLAIALPIALFLVFVPHGSIRDLSGPLYCVGLGMLVLVLIFGKTIHGAKSWFVLGPINFQPTEWAKMSSILYASALYTKSLEKTPYLSGFEKLKFLGLLGLPIILVIAQNDFSGSLSFIFVALSYSWILGIVRPSILLGLLFYGLLVFALFLLHIISSLKMTNVLALAAYLRGLGFGEGAGIQSWIFWFGSFFVFAAIIQQLFKSLFVIPRETSWRWALLLGLILSSSLVVSWMGWHSLKAYQKARVVSFILPNADPLGSGYHILQSKIAIGSGGLLGRGILLGSQAALGFLPERHTDFAFATLAEQVGFVGSLGVVVLFGALFWRLFRFVSLARDYFGKLVAIGFLALWASEACINLACVLGMMPILGIGLPFLSYGGSRLIMNIASLSILLSISRDFYVYR